MESQGAGQTARDGTRWPVQTSAAPRPGGGADRGGDRELVFDVASHVVDDGRFLAGGARWLIGVGVLGALAAASVGFLDLLAIPTGTRVFRTVLAHMSINLTVTAAYGLGES